MWAVRCARRIGKGIQCYHMVMTGRKLDDLMMEVRPGQKASL